MRPTVRNRTRFVNERMPLCARSGCTACTSLVRRYRPGERQSHAEHIDGHAAVTAVVSLASEREYEGDFFVSDLRTRILVPLALGDAVVHSSELWHGVDVSEGERFSWVDCVRTPHASYRPRADAEAGSLRATGGGK